MNLGRYGLMALMLTLISSCTPHHCRRSSEVIAPVPPGILETPEEMSEKAKAKIWVYKYDGSRQCKQGLEISLDEMAKELEGLKIFERAKKPDGLMHIQLCGSPTGMTNAYQINEEDLGKAEKKGFKKWSFD